MAQSNGPVSIVEEIYSFKHLMDESRLILLYSDNISSQTLESLVALTEEKLRTYPAETKTRKKVFHVTMECLQNISRHGQKGEDNLVSSLFIIGKDDDDLFFIISANNIAKKDEKELRDKLDSVNSMNPEELNKNYLEIIGNGKMSDKGGAGLGLIDIARKSKSKIQYHFKPLDENNVFFIIKVNIEN